MGLDYGSVVVNQINNNKTSSFFLYHLYINYMGKWKARLPLSAILVLWFGNHIYQVITFLLEQ
jgi:hypothetical protein